MTERMYNSSNDYWETPPEIFNPLNEEFHFKLDAAASAENSKCNFYIDEEEDAFKAEWIPGPVFCNPPYSKQGGPLSDWIERAYNQAIKHKEIIVMLLPSDTSTKWFHFLDSSPIVQIRFIKGRIKFLYNGIRSNNSPPMGNLIAVIRGDKYE